MLSYKSSDTISHYFLKKKVYKIIYTTDFISTNFSEFKEFVHTVFLSSIYERMNEFIHMKI